MNKMREKLKGFKIIPKSKEGKIVASVIAIIVIVILIVIAALYESGDIYTVFKDPDQLDEATWHKWNKKKSEHASYVGETTYDGSNPDIPFIVYEIPFRSEGEEEGGELEQMYNSNKNLLAAVDDEFVDARMDKAEEYVDTIFGQSYKTVSSDSDVYIASILDFYLDPTYYSTDEQFTDYDTEEESMNLTAFASSLAEFYVDNKITATYEWLTDDSLFYRTQYQYTTRGVCKLTLTSKDHENGELCEPFKELFGIEAYYGEEIDLILNIGFGAWYAENDTLGIGLVEIDTIDHAAEVLKISTY